jgi:hypothetical protein
MTAVNGVKLIGCMVVVYPEVAFCLERERHAAVLRKGVVHLCMHVIVDLSVSVRESVLGSVGNIRDRGNQSRWRRR